MDTTPSEAPDPVAELALEPVAPSTGELAALESELAQLEQELADLEAYNGGDG